MENENKGMELPNYPSSSHQNYCFAHGVVFVYKIVCLFIIPHYVFIEFILGRFETSHSLLIILIVSMD
jgi:hypothetical protein